MSYCDYDLGYDLGYDSEILPTQTITLQAQASQESGVVYQMSPPVQGVPRYISPAARYLEGAEAAPVGEGTGEAAASTAEDQAALSGITQTQQPEAGPGVSAAETVPLTAQQQQETRTAMESIAGDRGLLAGLPGWTPERRALFREQYSGRTASDLRTMVPANLPATQENSDRIWNQTRTDLTESIADRIESRYASGVISREQSMSMAAQAIRQRVSGNFANYRVPAEGATRSSTTSTRQAILDDIDRQIPPGSRELSTDMPLYQEAIASERQRFIEAARDSFLEVDRYYYGQSIRGEERIAQDADLLLSDRGIQNDPAAIARLRRSGHDGLLPQIRKFRQRFGRGPTRRGESPNPARTRAMQRADQDTLDRRSLSRRTQDQLTLQDRGDDRADARSEAQTEGQVRVAQMQIDGTAAEGDRQRVATAEENERSRQAQADQAMLESQNRMAEAGLQQVYHQMGEEAGALRQRTTNTLQEMDRRLTEMTVVRPPTIAEIFQMVQGRTSQA